MSKVLNNLSLSLLLFLCGCLPTFAQEESNIDYINWLGQNALTFVSDIATVSNGFDNSNACINFRELPYTIQTAIRDLPHAENVNNLTWLDNQGNVFTANGAWLTAGTYSTKLNVFAASNVTNKGIFKFDSTGNLTLYGNAWEGEIVSVFYWSKTAGGNDPFGAISFDASLCMVNPVEPPSIPTPDPFSCQFALNDVISNDYIASLIAYAESQSFTEPYYIYRVYYSDSAEDLNFLATPNLGYTNIEPFQIKGYVLTLNGVDAIQSYVLEYKQLRKLQTANSVAFAEFDLTSEMMYPFWELVLVSTCLDKSSFSEIDATNNVNASIQQTISQNAELISKTNQTNDLLSGGNQQSQSASNNASQSNDSLSQSLNDFERLEDELLSGLNDNLSNIRPNEFSFGSGFINSASWIATQMNTMILGTPFENVIVFSLILGLVLLILRRL